MPSVPRPTDPVQRLLARATIHDPPAVSRGRQHDDPPADVLSVTETVRLLRRRYETVQQLIAEGKLRTVQLGERRMVVRASVDELLGNRSPLAQEEAARTVRQAVAAALRRVADDLESGSAGAAGAEEVSG